MAEEESYKGHGVAQPVPEPQSYKKPMEWAEAQSC